VGEPGRRPFSARLLAPADRPLHAEPSRSPPSTRSTPATCPGTLEPSWSETLDRMLLSKPGVLGNHDGEPDMDWFGSEDVRPRRIELDRGSSASLTRASSPSRRADRP